MLCYVEGKRRNQTETNSLPPALSLRAGQKSKRAGPRPGGTWVVCVSTGPAGGWQAGTPLSTCADHVLHRRISGSTLHGHPSPAVAGGRRQGAMLMPFCSVPSKPPSLWPPEPTHQDHLSNALLGLGCPLGTTGHPPTPKSTAAPRSVPEPSGREKQLQIKNLGNKRMKQEPLLRKETSGSGSGL